MFVCVCVCVRVKETERQRERERERENERERSIRYISVFNDTNPKRPILLKAFHEKNWIKFQKNV